jgi:hypothetical protein
MTGHTLPSRAAKIRPDDPRTILRAMSGYHLALERGETQVWAFREALRFAANASYAKRETDSA